MRDSLYIKEPSLSISNNDVDDESAKIVICLFNVNLRERESQKSTHPEIENNTNHYVAFSENDVKSAWVLEKYTDTRIHGPYTRTFYFELIFGN